MPAGAQVLLAKAQRFLTKDPPVLTLIFGMHTAFLFAGRAEWWH